MEEKRYFTEGMNLDSEERLIPNGAYRYALNVRNSNSEQGAIGTISMLEGNQTIGTISLPSGYNKTVGQIDDPSNDREIFITFNSAGDNRIYIVDYKEDLIYQAYVDIGNTLELTSLDKISGINLSQNGADTHLLYVNSNGEPKNVNIDAGLRTWSTYYNNERLRGAFTAGASSEVGAIYARVVEFIDNTGATAKQQEVFYYRCNKATSNAPTSGNEFTPNEDWELCPSGYIYSLKTTKLVNTGGSLSGAISTGDEVTQDTSSATGDVVYFDSSTLTLVLIDTTGTFNTTDNIVVVPATDEITGGTWAITETDPPADRVTQIVKVPSKKSTNLYSTNSKHPFNNLINAWWQFKYLYVTADGRESSWSEVSDAPPPFFKPDSLIEGSDYKTKLDNNEIDIYLDAPDHTKYRSIKVAVRRNNNDKSPDDWYLIEDVPVTDDSLFVYTDSLKIRAKFSNSEVLMPMSQSQANQLFSWMPLDAEAQTVTSKNRVVYANFTEGRDFYLDDELGINKKAPSVSFYESDSPWVAAGQYPCDFEIKSATSTGAATYNAEKSNATPTVSAFSSTIDGGSDEVIAITFSNIVVGEAITLKLTGDNYMTKFGNSSTNRQGHSFQFTYIPTSTANSAAIAAFSAAINRTESFHDLDVWKQSGDDFDYYGMLASSGTSSAGGGGTRNYLYILPQKAINYTTSDDTHTEVTKMVDILSVSVSSKRNFKRGTIHDLGLVYEGDFGRKTSVIKHPNLRKESSWWSDAEFASVTASGRAGNILADVGARFGLVTLNHDAPSWAKKFYIVKSLDNGLDNYVQMPLVKNELLPEPVAGTINPFNGKYFKRGFVVDPTLDNGSTVVTAASLGGEEFIYVPLNSLQNNAQSYNGVKDSSITYQYTKGDRVRFCYAIASASAGSPTAKPTSTAQYCTNDLDFEIVKYYESLNCVALRVTDFPTNWTDRTVSTGSFDGVFDTDNEAGAGEGDGAGDVSGLVFEVYTPTVTRTDSFYYELYSGTVSADTANSRYYHMANSLENEQDQESASAAILMVEGDSYMKPRTYPVIADSTTPAGYVAATYVNYYIEEANLFDQIPSKTWGAGTPNRAVKNTSQEEDYAGSRGAVKRTNTLRYTEPFKPEEGYNGFGTIYDISFQDTNSVLKPIRKLHTDGNKLIIVHEDAVGYAQSDRQVIETVDGQGLTVAADTPISEPTYYGTDNGTLHPESFVFNGYRKYFYDNNKGEVLRLSNDGMTPISDQGMSKWFSQISREIEESQISRVIGAYDKRYDEYMLCFYRTTLETGNTSNFSANTFDIVIADIADYDVASGDSIGVKIDVDSAESVVSETTGWITGIASTTVTVELTAADYTIAAAADAVSLHLPKVDVVTFSEKLGKWTSFSEYVPDWFGKAGLDFISFKQGTPYIHNDTANPCSFYGTDHDAFVDVVANEDPDEVKQWLAFGLKSDVTWGASGTFTSEIDVPVGTTLSGTDFEMDAGVITGRDQRTTTELLEYKEQQLYAPYQRAKDAADTDYLEGDRVKGFWQKTRIRFNGGGTKMYKVFSVIFKYVKSQYTR